MRAADRRAIGVSAAALLLLLLASLTLFLTGKHWARRTLFFPEISSARLAGETRFLPRRPTLEGNVRLLLEETILGPEMPMHRPLVPRQTRLQSVLVRQRDVYVSLSDGILQADADTPFTPEQSLEALSTLVLFNFPRIRRLELLIEGQVPRGGSLFGYRPELLR
jgi:hypothetical protein